VNAHVLWYMTRATGIVALVLLTATTVLGVLTSVRLSTARWPGFAWQDLHRRLSLIAVVFIGLHIATTVADGYTPIGWVSAVVPFTSPYRRLWLGLGTVAVDLLLAVGISSMLRRRIRPGTWRALHWLAYVSWPLALVHAFGTGTDPRMHWVLLLLLACVAAVVAAAVWRLRAGWPGRAALRAAIGGVGLLSVVMGSAWAAAGPLRSGWAARAGTPSSMLRTSTTANTSTASTSASLPAAPFEASLNGTISQRSLSDGQVEVDIAGTITGGAAGVLAIHLVGSSDDNGGVALNAGSGAMGPAGSPGQYQGRVTGLEGPRIDLALTSSTGAPLEVAVDLSINGNAVTGQLSAVP